MKRFCSFLLVFAMVFTFCPSAFAASPETQTTPIQSAGEYITVPDNEGNLYTVWVESTLYRSSPTKSSDGSSIDGQYYEGDQIEIVVDISNSQLNGAAWTGEAVSAAAKKAMGKIVANAVIKKIGSTFAGGIGVASFIIDGVASINSFWGNDGFIVTVTLEAQHFQHQIQGIDVLDWGLVGIDIDTY